MERDTLLLGFFSDERPPRGYCGLVDWRLNGLISAEIAGGRISGSFPEKLAIAFPKRLRCSRLLLFGLGPLAALTYDKLYNAGYEMAETANGIGTTDLALPMPAAGRGPLRLDGMTEAMLTGVYDGFKHKSGQISAIDLEIPGRPEHTGDIHRGADLFRRHAGEAAIEIIEGGEPADNTGALQEGPVQKAREMFT